MKLTSPGSGRLSPERMYALLLASDPAYNGRFFAGVLTTGVYCLPSCRARKPKRDHVRFFINIQAARAAGLRACKKCHPDDFARGADPVLESIETLVAEVRADPAAFPDTAAMVRRSGYGATRLFELFRLQFSRPKAEYTLGLARAVAEEKLNPDALRRLSATRAERTLPAVRGLGPWSVNYVMMRSLGFADCMPLGDTGVGSGLQALFHLDERPEIAAARRLMAGFAPYRSLATAHLWQFNQPIPE